jgi:23S rRNA (cytosine1962-C5)-methyltransferase
MDLDATILRARLAREPLIRSGQSEAFRILHGAPDGVDGLIIEQWRDVLIAQFHSGHLQIREDVVRAALDRLRRDVNARAVYRKIFLPDRAQVPAEVGAMHVSPQPWLGDPVEAEIPVSENGLKFLIRPYDGFSVGLFLEHRDNRKRICELAKGRRVLNAFSYTCGFSVAAAAGGAQGVASVDLSRRYLEWGKRNFEANGIGLTGHLFFCSDVLDFYTRAERQGRRFDLIILDAPTFARMRRLKRALVLDRDLGDLLGGALNLLDPGGIVLVGTNARQISLERMEQEIRTAAAPRPCTILERPSPPLDFAGDPDYSKTIIARID